MNRGDGGELWLQNSNLLHQCALRARDRVDEVRVSHHLRGDVAAGFHSVLGGNDQGDDVPAE